MIRRVGVRIRWTPRGPGVGPVLPEWSTEAERQKAGEEAGKAALFLSKASAVQKKLFQHLAEASPDGYFAPEASWIDAVLKATKGLRETDVERLRTFDWTPSDIRPEALRKKIREALKPNR